MFIGYEFSGQERLGDDDPLARAADIRPAMIGGSEQSDDRRTPGSRNVPGAGVVGDQQACPLEYGFKAAKCDAALDEVQDLDIGCFHHGSNDVGFTWRTAHEDGELVALRQQVCHGGEAIGRPPLDRFVRAGIHNDKRSVHSCKQRFGGAVLSLSHNQLHLQIDLVHLEREPTNRQVVMEG